MSMIGEITYLNRRNWKVEARIAQLAQAREGVTRQDLLAADLSISMSGLDTILRRLVEEGTLSYQKEKRDRSSGLLRHNGKRSRFVRVYRTTGSKASNR